VIICDKLTRKYGALTAVNGVSFEIGRGEIVGLLGHNGAGKTTIMKMMTGYLEPTAGKVSVDGVDVVYHRQQAQAKIGYLPENGPLYSDMTVYDFLVYTADLRGVPLEKQARAVRDAMKKTDITAKATHIIQTLSRGYRQRVGVTQALLHRPPILILDEPTNGLDPSQVQHMRTLIRDLAKESTVVLSTHILQEVDAVCSRVLIVSNGRLVLDKKLSELQKIERLRLSIDKSPAEALPFLQSLNGVTAVEPLSQPGGEYHYALSTNGDGVHALAPLVARRVVEKGYLIYSLAPELRDLERVFREANELPQEKQNG
jgi:ABC-2 type transport system ATP-binding protein